jgi:predicted RNA binding protein YcfA (HicA-like mRNA interferase family)
VLKYLLKAGEKMTFREAQKMIHADGWRLDSIEGSHYHYQHSTKCGKVTIPYHNGDIPKGTLESIKRQAGLK